VEGQARHLWLTADNESASELTLLSIVYRINSIDLNEKTATVNFEKPSAAKTALMLNGGTLDGAQITVTSETVNADHPDEHGDGDDSHFDQSDKPRAGIAAEYLAKGYTLSDSILQRAIEIDSKQGISKRFLSYMNSLDSAVGSKVLGPEKTISGKVQETAVQAQQQAKAVDEQRGLSKTATDYYSRAVSSPFGQKVLAFYTTTTKQVLDIHEEARRLAHEQKTGSGSHETTHEGAPSAPPPVVPAPVTGEKAPTVV
jgi:hypothetical protein